MPTFSMYTEPEEIRLDGIDLVISNPLKAYWQVVYSDRDGYRARLSDVVVYGTPKTVVIERDSRGDLRVRPLGAARVHAVPASEVHRLIWAGIKASPPTASECAEADPGYLTVEAV